MNSVGHHVSLKKTMIEICKTSLSDPKLSGISPSFVKDCLLSCENYTKLNKEVPIKKVNTNTFWNDIVEVLVLELRNLVEKYAQIMCLFMCNIYTY